MSQPAESYFSENQKLAADGSLADAEIARLLKSVQAAQFKKSEALKPEKDTSFKPRTLVEIAFEAEKKRQEEAARKMRAQTLTKDSDAGITEPAKDAHASSDKAMPAELSDSVPASGDELSASLDGPEDFSQQEQAEQEAEAARLQRQAEDESLRAKAEEEGYKKGFEAGLEAARSAEPTEEEIAIAAEREQERAEIIERLEKVISAAAGPDAVDITLMANALEKAVLKLASARAGMAIQDNPEGLVRRIEAVIEKVKASAQSIQITLNPEDLQAVETWKARAKSNKKWSWKSDASLAAGDIRIKLDGITLNDVLDIQRDIMQEDLVPAISALEPSLAEEAALEEATSEEISESEQAPNAEATATEEEEEPLS